MKSQRKRKAEYIRTIITIANLEVKEQRKHTLLTAKDLRRITYPHKVKIKQLIKSMANKKPFNYNLPTLTSL